VTPLVEPLSIDEAFLDVAGARRLYGTATEIGALLRGRIRDETGLTASVGVATTKFLAKIASDMAKPDGMLVVAAGRELEFLHPLPVERLWGVGPATFARLERMGVRTVGDVAEVPLDALVAVLGNASGRHLHALAGNVDERPVKTRRVAKSIGAEETFGADLTAAPELDRELMRLVDRMTSRLRTAGVVARTVTVKVRYADFETATRARTLDDPADTAAAVLRVARSLLDGAELGRGVRLLGVHASQLTQRSPVQPALDLGSDVNADVVRDLREAAIESAVDEVRARFGAGSVGSATLLGRPDRTIRGESDRRADTTVKGSR
jgi:DNA polymerase-4